MGGAYGLGTRFRKAVLAAGLAIGVLLGSAATGSAADPIRLLILGDSLTAGYGLAHSDGFQPRLAAALAERGMQVTLIDGAVSGDTSAGGLARLDWVLGNGGIAAAMQANLTAILDRLAARHVQVLLTGMHAPPNLGADYTKAYDAAFQHLASRPALLYDPFFLEGVAGDPSLNQADGIHPNPEGVRRIVARMLPLVERLLREAQKSEQPSK